MISVILKLHYSEACYNEVELYHLYNTSNFNDYKTPLLRLSINW